MRRRADCELARAVRVERRWSIHVGCRVSAFELRHFNHLAMIGLRQPKNIVRRDEFFERSNPPFHFLCQVLRTAMLLCNGSADFANGCAPTLFIIWWQGGGSAVATPKLPRNDVHLPLDTLEFGFGFGHNLIGIDRCVQFQSEFLREFLLPQSPLALGAR